MGTETITDASTISGEVSKVQTAGLYNIKDEKARLEKIDRYVDTNYKWKDPHATRLAEERIGNH